MLIGIIHKTVEEREVIRNFWKKNFGWVGNKDNECISFEHGVFYYCIKTVDEYGWKRTDIYHSSVEDIYEIYTREPYDGYFLYIGYEMMEDVDKFKAHINCYIESKKLGLL